MLGNVSKVQGLIDFSSYTEERGGNVDGIVAEIVLDINTDKTQIETLLEALAASEKLIKVSVDIGTGGTTAQATQALYMQQEEMYKWFVTSYFEHIPTNLRSGILFRSPTDRASSSSWRPNEPVGIWTNSAGHERKPAYRGVLEALQDQ